MYLVYRFNLGHISKSHIFFISQGCTVWGPVTDYRTSGVQNLIKRYTESDSFASNEVPNLRLIKLKNKTL